MRNIDPPALGLQFNGLQETIRAVIAGFGAIIASALEVNDYVQRGEVARVYVKDVDLHNPIALCRRAADPLSPAAEYFLQSVMNLYPAKL
jgi:DNA-binding transcriptional LysR family regulator